MNHKRSLHLSVIAAVGIAALGTFVFLARQSDAARANFYQAQRELELSRKGVWHLGELDAKALEQQLIDMNARFSPSEELGVLIGELTELAKTCDISIRSISPSEKMEAHAEQREALSALSRVPIDMRLLGTYEPMAKFLSQLSALRHGIMTVERFRLEKETAEDSSPLVLSLVASAFVRKAPDHDLLKEEISMTSPMERRAGKSRFARIGRNPFGRVVVDTAVEAPVTLEGILYDPVRPIALVNGEAKAVGDVVNGMKILEIHPDSVVLEKGGQKTKMRLRWD